MRAGLSHSKRTAAQEPHSPRGVMVALLLAGALLGTHPQVEAADKQTPAQKEAELKRVQTRIDKVRKAVNADIEKRDRLGAQLRDAELGVQAARKQLETVREQRIQSESQLQEFEREQARREQELAAERAALAGELRTAYVNGREEQLKLLLNQEDPASFGRTLAYYGYFGRARAGRIDGIREKLEHLALVREKIAAETERLRQLEVRQQEEVDALRAAQKQRTRAVAAIDTQIKTGGGELTRLQSQARSLERLIAELRKALENVPVAKQAPFENLRGKLPWPVQSGKVLAKFGQPRAGGSLRWQGMLVGTDRGARVRAPFAGRVVYADWLPGMGLMIVIDHGKGYMSLYGHNEELFRRVGEPVTAGDVIASVGDSGGHNQPALYFEVRRGREPVNPEIWLQRR
ncbi:MAG TPA: peptidoglycan DD-metalloendopeptidase family protein [Steroidobacteraceae bacterium]